MAEPIPLSLSLEGLTAEGLSLRFHCGAPDEMQNPDGLDRASCVLIEVHAPDFVRWVGTVQADRESLFK